MQFPDIFGRRKMKARIAELEEERTELHDHIYHLVMGTDKEKEFVVKMIWKSRFQTDTMIWRGTTLYGESLEATGLMEDIQ